MTKPSNEYILAGFLLGESSLLLRQLKIWWDCNNDAETLARIFGALDSAHKRHKRRLEHAANLAARSRQ